MDKLSSILPSSPRVKSVDLKSAHPARPGAPRFGRPQGSVSSDRMTLSSAAKDMAFQETLAARNPREEAHSQIAKDVTRKFFETRLDETAPTTTADSRLEVALQAPTSAAIPEASATADVPSVDVPAGTDSKV